MSFPKNLMKFLAFFLMAATSFSLNLAAEEQKLIIIGGGHVGLIQALQAHLNAKKNGRHIKITVFEKNSRVEDTTAANIWNSHTPDEIVSVVPRGDELRRKLEIPFNQPGGILISDVLGINDSAKSLNFIEQVSLDGRNVLMHEKRTEALLKLGRAGMALWKETFENADDELREILSGSNFNPCWENDGGCKDQLYNGYRIDLIYDVPDARARAEAMISSYNSLGYKMCQILSPDEVVARDPSLADFCAMHSDGEIGKRSWRNDSVALWRPGGCLDTQQFLPKLVNYLAKVMGTYISKNGTEKNRFQFKLGKEVAGVIIEQQEGKRPMIKGLRFADGNETKEKANQDINYIFCPGEAVGTLEKLGFIEPAYAGFAGASLSLEVPVSEVQAQEFEGFNHYMEVHKEGVVLAWQGRMRDGKVFLGGAGTKAFYGDVSPHKDEMFARTNNLLQLNMFNDVLPKLVSMALGRNTMGQRLTMEDMEQLEQQGFAKRWVGRRAVAFDGFPTVGLLYFGGHMVKNAQVTTHLGSGGGSFSWIMSKISNYELNPELFYEKIDELNLSREFLLEVLEFSASNRKAQGLL